MSEAPILKVVDTATGEIVAEIDGDNVRSNSPVPQFEGRDVDHSSIKVSGSVHVEHDGAAADISIDDRIRVVGEYVVTGVRHYVDPKSGLLIREATVRAIDGVMELMPWDPTDKDDDGIVRARRRS